MDGVLEDIRFAIGRGGAESLSGLLNHRLFGVSCFDLVTVSTEPVNQLRYE